MLGPPRLQRIPRRSYNCKKLQQKLIGFCHFILSSEALYAIAVYKIPKTGQKAKFHQILGNIVYECHFSFLFNRIEEASPEESLLPQFYTIAIHVHSWFLVEIGYIRFYTSSHHYHPKETWSHSQLYSAVSMFQTHSPVARPRSLHDHWKNDEKVCWNLTRQDLWPNDAQATSRFSLWADGAARQPGWHLDDIIS